MSDTVFDQFSLAEGTALSLLIGHRKSIDLDLFTIEEFNPSQLEKYLQDKYAFRGDFREGFSLKGEVKNANWISSAMIIRMWKQEYRMMVYACTVLRILQR